MNSNLDPFEMFSKLREINPSPYGSYMNFDKFKVISSSPERFIKTAICPVKGVLRRDKIHETADANPSHTKKDLRINSTVINRAVRTAHIHHVCISTG